ATGQDTPGSVAGVVMAQEIGHNWGQYHTGHVSADNWRDPICCPHGGISRSLTDLAYGFDTRTMQVIPPGPQSGSHAHDFMVGGCDGGCPTLPFWISDYTYERLLTANTIRPLGQAQPQLADTDDGQRMAGLGGQGVDSRQYMFVSGHVGDSPALDPSYVLDRP